MKDKSTILLSEKKIITILCLISLCYSLLVGSGFYGYSNDYYGYYYQKNLNYLLIIYSKLIYYKYYYSIQMYNHIHLLRSNQ